jgi:ATP-dependent protease ClpP protease subunit
MSDAKNTAVIDFFCDITEKTANQLIAGINEAISFKLSKIIIRLSSSGGDLVPAFGAYNFLRYSKVPLTICNMGNVESSAILLYLAADARLAVPGSRFLFHPLHWTFIPNLVHIPKIKEALASLEFDTKRYRDIFNERTQGAENPIDVLKCLDGDPLIVGADVARHRGITTEDPAEPAIPAGAFHRWVAS